MVYRQSSADRVAVPRFTVGIYDVAIAAITGECHLRRYDGLEGDGIATKMILKLSVNSTPWYAQDQLFMTLLHRASAKNRSFRLW